MPGVCAYPLVGAPRLEKLAADATQPRLPANRACESRRHLIRLVPPVPGLWNCFTHTNCVCNDLIAAVNRVCGWVPVPTPAALAVLAKETRLLAKKMGHIAPYSYDQVLATWNSKLRKRYQDAYESLSAEPLCRRDARVSAFVKSEKFDPVPRVNPDPRMIQSRHPRYNVVVARYLKPIEKALYALRGPHGLRMVAKGLNQRQRAELLRDKLALFDDPVLIGLDGSRFDKHVHGQVLRLEHLFYTLLIDSDELRELLAWQLVNDVVTQNGVKYKVRGKRMSGDINTALGNCVLMIIMVRAAMRILGIKNRDWDILDDGDDCILILEAQHLKVVQAELPAVFLTFGQELKVESVARDIRDTVFCQSKVLDDGTNLVFTRYWRKVLSQSACGVKHWGTPSMVRPMLTAVGRCELALARGIPILQEFALALVRNGRGLEPRRLDLDGGLALKVKYEMGWAEVTQDLLRAVKPAEVTESMRVAFDRTWGVSVAEQLHVEAILREWVVETTVAVDFPVERVAPNWEDATALENELPML